MRKRTRKLKFRYAVDLATMTFQFDCVINTELRCQSKNLKLISYDGLTHIKMLNISSSVEGTTYAVKTNFLLPTIL